MFDEGGVEVVGVVERPLAENFLVGLKNRNRKATQPVRGIAIRGVR